MLNDKLSTRRVFLQRGLAILAAAPTIPTFLDQTMLAMAGVSGLVQGPSGKDGKILVIVQLSGGNDGMSMVVPYGDDAYHVARPQIHHEPNSVLKINNYLGLHPNLAQLKSLYDNGQMAIVQGVGYPNPNRSHFRAMDIWHTAAPEKENVTTGWIGRYFDNTCCGSDPTTKPAKLSADKVDPEIGVSIGETLPLAMQGAQITPLSLERPDAYRYKGNDQKRYVDLNKPYSEHEGAELDFLHRTVMDAQLSSDQILGMTQRHQPRGEYPNNEFGQGLRTIAAMIAGGMPTRVYYVSLGGFDTHAGQKNRHDQLMQQLSQGISAFMADLADQKNDQRVLMMTFSEFGRRVSQNASGGTDHGAAAPMLLIGKPVKAGIVGNHPSLSDLDQGDLKYGVDFRNVYASVLQKWMDTPSKPILGQQFRLLDVV